MLFMVKSRRGIFCYNNFMNGLDWFINLTCPSCRNSTEEFLKRGFGFCLVRNNEEIVSWGIADWVTEGKAEMGIETDENYRQKGFATLVTSATAEYCQKKGIELAWHCSEHNEASWRTAEKAGFVKERDYTAAIGHFDENYNLWENAWYRGLYLKHPEEGLNYINRLLSKIEPESRHLQIKAQILIQAEQAEKALEVLQKAVSLGPQNIERFRTNVLENDFFKSVRKLKGFSLLIEKLDKLIDQD